MYVVTGGAGFVGSHLVRALNDQGVRDVLVVDDLTRGAKFENLRDCVLADYLDKAELRRLVERDGLPKLTAILHQGACANTMERDGRYLMDNNFTCSKELLHFALRRKTPFVYASSASVYGLSRDSREDPALERPLNAYGWSKLVFDQHVRRLLPEVESTVIGLRYFNVYGGRERHKGRMASMVHQLWRQLSEQGVARLFEGTEGYADGEQRRDFVYVGDVARINLAFAQGPPRQGVLNLGTGQSESFNQVARAIIARLGRGRIEYVPFDPALRGRYQSFTQADLTRLRAAGWSEPFTPLADGIAAAVTEWQAWATNAPAPAAEASPAASAAGARA